MHIPTPDEIRNRREALGLRQTEVARRAGISQSMVARIEAGSVDPRAGTLNKIIAVLNRAEQKQITAAQIMHAPVISVHPDDSIAMALEMFEKNNISQLPVIEYGVPVGCISESVIVKAIEQQRLHRSQPFFVRDFIETGFPTVPPDIDIGTVIGILQQHHAVLVVEGGKVRGVITKHDLISLIV
jgi:predicted transcriptional regulator